MAELDYNVDQLVKGDLLARHAIYLLKRGAMAVQAERGLPVDGLAGPKTRAAIDLLLGVTKPAIAPVGKGMFIRTLKLAGTREHVLATMKNRDLAWVAIKRIWQYEDPVKPSSFYNTDQLPLYAGDLRAAGREVWIWGYPAPGKHDEFVATLVGAAVAVKARGVILDPEEPFLGQPAAAAALMTATLAATTQHGLGLGVTSYGGRWNFPEFPWSAFLGADFGMPQIYDAKNDLPPDYPVQSVNAWKAKGFQHIVPISAAFAKTKAQMMALLKATPVTDALCWWDWFKCNESPGRWDIVNEYTLGG